MNNGSCKTVYRGQRVNASFKSNANQSSKSMETKRNEIISASLIIELAESGLV